VFSRAGWRPDLFARRPGRVLRIPGDRDAPPISQPARTAWGTILAARRSTSGCAKRINPRVVGEKTRRAIEEASDEELLLLPWIVWGEGVMGKVLGDFSFAIWDASHQTLPLKNRRGSSNPASIWKTTGNCSGQAVGDRLPGGKVSFSPERRSGFGFRVRHSRPNRKSDRQFRGAEGVHDRLATAL
jgi:hypothetical protein